MTNKEAIKHLEFLKIAKLLGATPNEINVEALNLAIKALETNDRLLSVSNDVRRILRGDV